MITNCTYVLRKINVYPVAFSISELDVRLIEPHSTGPVVHVKNGVSLLKLQRHEILDLDLRAVSHRAEVKHQAVVYVRRYLET